MESLLTKGIGELRRQEIPAGRNRMVGIFSPVPELPFPELVEAIQPLFQAAGHAPRILIREPGQHHPTYAEVNINHPGNISGLAFGVPLFDPAAQRPATLELLNSFEDLCNKTADTITTMLSPKGWFTKRRSSSSIMAKPVFVSFPMPKEAALQYAAAYAKFMADLPRYERTVRIDILGVEAEAEEVTEFLDFCGFPGAEQVRLWYEREYGVAVSLKDKALIFAIPSVPRTVAPDIIYNNLTEIARRFTLEFGGTMRADSERAAQTMVGWRNVLARVNLVPGDDESREFFQDPIAPAS